MHAATGPYADYDPARYAGAYAHGYPDLAPGNGDADARAYGATGYGVARTNGRAYVTGDTHPDDAHGAGAYVYAERTGIPVTDIYPGAVRNAGPKHRADTEPDALRQYESPWRFEQRYPWRPYDGGFWDYAEDAFHGKHCAYPGLHWD